MRFEIRYASEYDYDAPVVGNHNRLRMTPASVGTQRLEHFDVRVEPGALTHRYADLFGNEVVELLVAGPHESLRVEVDALVATTQPLPAPDSPWASLRSYAYREVAGPYLYHPWAELPDLGDLPDAVRRPAPAETVRAVMELIPERFRYESDATDVTSTVGDLLRSGAGVCQDFAHLALVLLREHGVAARYVSGYFYAVDDQAAAAASAASAEVQTHAWVEALLPVPGDAAPIWFGVDPTNRQVAGERHVKIGHGRLYEDVPPVEGTFAGTATSTVDAHVTMMRVEARLLP